MGDTRTKKRGNSPKSQAGKGWALCLGKGAQQAGRVRVSLP